MKNRFLGLLLTGVILLFPIMVFGQINSADGLRMPGDWNGFANTTGMGGDFDLVRITEGQLRWTTTFEFTDETGIQNFKFVSTSGFASDPPWGNQWASVTGVTPNTFSTVPYTSDGSVGDNTITVVQDKWYTVNFADNGYAATDFIFMETSTEPVSIDTATGVPTEAVAENQSVTINIELDSPKSAEEKVYVRYSTDNFATSEAIEVTGFGAGTSGTVSIPGQLKNTSVDFYVLTTTIDKANWAGKPDLATIDFQNNGGANYSYFYEADISPLNGAENVSRMPELKWYQQENLAGYDLQLDDDSDFSSLIIDESDLADTTFTVTEELGVYSDYYWRFKADTASSWSRTFTFRTTSEITFANLQFPETAVIDEGNNVNIYGQVFVPGITEMSGSSSDIQAWIGLNAINENPENWGEASWSLAAFNSTSTTAGDNDEYQLNTGAELEPGSYYYAYRYQYLEQDLVYGVIGGIWDDTTQVLGQLVILDIPELNEPSSAADNISLEPELTWATTDTSIAEYNLQVSDDALFTTPIIDEQNLDKSSSSYTIAAGLLEYDNTYFWRVRSEYDTTASGWSETFSFTTTQNIPGAVTLNAPSDTEEDISIQPSLSWTAESASTTYDIQISTSSDFSLAESIAVDASGISGTDFSVSDTTLLSAQTYYWRVRGVNTAGSGPWTAPFSFSTVVTVPNLLSPSDEAIDIPTTTPLSWNHIPGALTYDVQVSRNSAFSGANVVIDSTAHNDTLIVVEDLNLKQLYYWRIKANYAEASSEWSAAYSFTVKDAPPLKPLLLNPDSAATDVQLNTSLSWEVSTDAESYQVQLSQMGDFSSGLIIDSTGITATTIETPELSHETTYYWRVRGYNTSGGFGAWSETGVFTTLPSAPSATVLISPSDTLNDLGVPIEFKWDSVAGASSYEFQFSKSDAFSFTYDSTLSDTSLILSDFESGSVYYWRVRTLNAGGKSEWSSVHYFEAGVGGSDGPNLLTPGNAKMDTGTEVSFAWGELAGADSYQFQLSGDESFSDFVSDSSGITTSELKVEDLAKGNMYYWRVRGEDSKGQSNWSEVFSFNTEVSLPGNVILDAPIDSATDLSLPVTFSWSPAFGANVYELRLSEQADFSVSTDSSAITDTTLTLGTLAKNSSYYWKVRAINIAGKGPWSATHYFTTNIALPGITELVTPENTETVPATVRFGWNKAVNAESYELQIAKAQNFESLEIDSASIEELTIQLEGFEQGATYYWRVRGVNRAGEGAWSDTSEFKIEMLTSLGQETTPNEFALHPNYPNPFNPTTNIEYDLKHAGQVKIQVYDISGRLIQTLVNERKSAGRYKSVFEAGNLASGIYLIRMEAPGFLENRKMTLIK